MQYDVTSVGLDPITGKIVAPPRTERIDPDVDVFFEGCAGPWEIEDAYELYWNRVNDNWEWVFPRGKEKVKVLRVEQVRS